MAKKLNTIKGFGVLRAALTLTVFFFSFAHARAQQMPLQHALIIGNASYERAHDLNNPLNDARDVAARLAALGFSIHGGSAHLDLGRDDLLEVMRDFSAQVPDGATALVFFAGHGVSNDGDTFLIPTDDGALVTRSDLASHAVALRELTGRLAARGDVASIVLVDACRANGLRDEHGAGAVRGAGGAGDLVAGRSGSLHLIYAAAPGQIAADGDGRNSPFTGALLSVLEDPARRVDTLFFDLSAQVRARTDGHQLPWMAQILATDQPPFFLTP
jgi:uncharacterized caspase-like protein